MELEYESRIVGEFAGWEGDNVYELANGTKWQQVRHKYEYRYKDQPEARIWKDGAKYLLEIEGMDEMIQVRRVYA